jgi:hypothetical protein
MSESAIQNRIRLAISKQGGALALRNNTGLFKTFDGRTVQAGMGTGTSDLIGLTSHIITPEDVGRLVGIFLAIEVKTDIGRLRTEQSAFLSQVTRMGGVGGIARSDDDAISLISKKWDSPVAWKASKR